VQCFRKPEDLDQQNCTIEEREEYEPYVNMGIPIYAGVDYQAILEQAQQDADIVLWDGGNNDFSFIRPNLDIVVVDALRAGHEIEYFPGEVNFRRADVLVISKAETALPGDVRAIKERAKAINPKALCCTADLEISVDKPELMRGQRVLVIEDGPTVTHGGMSFGAGIVAAEHYGARPVNPRSYAQGTIRGIFETNPHLERVLPAMGYSDEQRQSLRATALACCKKEKAACIVDASPARFDWEFEADVPVVRVSYRFVQLDGPPLLEKIFELLNQQ
jgi:predicted GTPase